MIYSTVGSEFNVNESTIQSIEKKRKFTDLCMASATLQSGKLMRRSPGEGNGNPLQYPYLENLMDRGTWWVAVCEAAKSQTQLNSEHTQEETAKD